MGGHFKIDRDFDSGLVLFQVSPISVLFPDMAQIGMKVNLHWASTILYLTYPFIRKRFKKGARFLPNAPQKKNGKKIARYLHRFSIVVCSMWHGATVCVLLLAQVKTMSENQFRLALLFPKLCFRALSAIFKSRVMLSLYPSFSIYGTDCLVLKQVCRWLDNKLSCLNL